MTKLQFTHGMSVPDRIALREQVEAEYVERARREAKQVHRSLACREANAMYDNGTPWTADQIANKHASCNAEALGGGCLDECHDAAIANAAAGGC